jgi:hypothetical protein
MSDDEIPFAPVATQTPHRLDYIRQGTEPGDLALLIPSRLSGEKVCEILIIVAIAGILVAILMPSMATNCGPPGQTSCASGLRQIIVACMNYAEDHGGTFPNSYALMTGTPRYLTPDCFNCFVTDRKSIVIGSRGSFVYCGGNLTRNSDPECVVAYEHPSNHAKRELVNIGYNDGSVRTTPMKQAMQIIVELQAGHNPPRAEMLK